MNSINDTYAHHDGQIATGNEEVENNNAKANGPRQSPSQNELILLRSVWRHKRLSAREIHDASVRKTNWSYSTTRKTLDRMVAKGLLGIELVHGIKTFVPLVGKLETLADLISNFAKNILDSDQPIPAAAFIHSAMVEPEEIEALELLLRDYDKKRNTEKENKEKKDHKSEQAGGCE